MKKTLAVLASLIVSMPIFAQTIDLQEVSSGYDKPVAMKFIPGTNDYVVLEQRGKIYLVRNGQKQTMPALDFSERVSSIGNETGLLGIAFHPDFAQNGKVYLNFTAGLRLRTYVTEFVMNGNSIAGDTEREVLSFGQPFPNHNGGDLQFGPDGYLYIASGDGGGANDTLGNGQKLDTFLGKILRIDVNSAPYAIPADNPFVGVDNAQPEIYAYGLRNPWRFSFDTATGALWAGDVGQNAWEEIDIITSGGNYGWGKVEGFECFRDENCDLSAFIPPVHVYGRDEGISITGGFVYRGNAIPSLYGKYLYADYGFGTIWGLNSETYQNEGLLATGLNPSAFAQDPDGEVYILDHTSGSVFKIVPR